MAVVYLQDAGGRSQLREHRVEAQRVRGKGEFVRRVGGEALFAAKNKQQRQEQEQRRWETLLGETRSKMQNK